MKKFLILFLLICMFPSVFPATINMPQTIYNECQKVKFSVDNCIQAWCQFSGEEQIRFKTRCGLQNQLKLKPGEYVLSVSSKEGEEEKELTVYPKPVYIAKSIVGREFALKIILGITIFVCILLLWKTI